MGEGPPLSPCHCVCAKKFPLIRSVDAAKETSSSAEAEATTDGQERTLPGCKRETIEGREREDDDVKKGEGG